MPNLTALIEYPYANDMTTEQQRKWIRRCAQLIRHYRFYYTLESQQAISRGPGEATRFIWSAVDEAS